MSAAALTALSLSSMRWTELSIQCMTHRMETNAPQVTVSWPDPIAPELAEGIAVAQAAAQTVPSNGWNNHHKFHFPKPCDIKAEARRVMGLGGLFLAFVAESMDPWPTDLPTGEALSPNPTPIAMLRQTFLLGHKSGSRIQITVETPVFSERGRPADKAKNAAATNGLKYLLAGVLALGWDDPREDSDGRDDRSGRGARAKERKDQRQESTEAPKTEYDRVYAALRKEAWESVARAKQCGIERDTALNFATGCETGMAKGMMPSQLLAVREFGIALEQMAARPRTHAEFLGWLDRSGIPALWRHCEPTDRAADFDRRMVEARNQAPSATSITFPAVEVVADGPPEFDPETGEFPDESESDEPGDTK